MKKQLVCLAAATAAFAAFGADVGNGRVVVSNVVSDATWNIASGGELRLGADIGPLVHWTFNEASAPGADSGSLGRSFDISGTEYNAKIYPTNDAIRGACLQFDGTKHIGLSSAGLPTTGAFTIMGWMKPETLNGVMLSWGTTQAGKLCGLRVSSGKPQFFFWGSDMPADSTVPCDGSTWVHLAGVFDPDAASGQKMRLYVNGQLAKAMDNNSAVNLTTSGNTLLLGLLTGRADSYFKGAMDDVTVVGEALAAERILEAMKDASRAEYLPANATVAVAQGGKVSVGIAAQTFGGLSGDGALEAEPGATATFSSAGTQSIGEITGGGRAVVASGTLQYGVPEYDFSANVMRHYTFDDAANPGADSSAAAALTLTAYDSDGTVVDWSAVMDASVPGAIRFDGSHYLTSSGLGNLPAGDSAYTIIVRLTFDQLRTDGISSWGNPSSRKMNGLVMKQDNGNWAIENYNWGADLAAPLGYLQSTWAGTPANGWHTLVVTYDPTVGSKAIYCDGSLLASGSVSGLNVQATYFSIGRRMASWVYDYHKGYIDDFCILNCAVDANEAAPLMAGASSAGTASITVSAPGTLSVPSSKTGVVGAIAADGTLAVSGSLAIADGDSSVAGSMTGAGRLVVRSGARLDIAGTKDFAGTVAIDGGSLGGVWSMANATVALGTGGELLADGSAAGCAAGALTLAENGVADLGEFATGAAYWTSGAAIALPTDFTVKVDAGTTRASGERTVIAAPSVSGSAAGWTLDIENLRANWTAGLRQKANGIEFYLLPPGTVLYIR